MKFIKLSLLLIFVQLTAAQAQTNIQNWIKKCESIPTVDQNIIVRRDPTTMAESRKTVTIDFKNNPALKKELLEAIELDKAGAYYISESKTNGVISPTICRFMDKKNIETRFIFSFSNDNAGATVTMQIYYEPLEG